MKVQEVMTTNAKVCTLTDNLSAAAGLMWENDCGALPVVAEGEKVVGLITDRDICMAANLNNRNLWNIAVEEVISGRLFACTPEDDIHSALKTMQKTRSDGFQS
jgi:CBS domain-containing protein